MAAASTNSIRLDIEAAPGARPRVTKQGWAYYPKKYRMFLDATRKLLSKVPRALIKRGIEVTVIVAIARPKTTILPFPKPDIDNFIKGVFDAANKIVWADDWLIYRVIGEKKWVDGPSYIEISWK
jgi:Holliday junction resolvase RusA-like endonuclease